MNKTRRCALLALVGLVAACGGPQNTDDTHPELVDNAPSDNAPSDNAPVDNAPIPTVDAVPVAAPELEWTVDEAFVVAGVPLEKATLNVPLDYRAPDAARLELFVTRFKPPEGVTSRGVLMYNPGGPGEPVAIIAPAYAEQLRELFPSFDIVLMDNRGTGISAPIDCVSRDDDRFDETMAPPHDDVRASLEFEGRVTLLLKEACQTRFGDALRYFNTENVARDMNAVRAALGVEQLNYWGVSYGAMQGALYAKLFPEHVGAFVLDSPAVRLPEHSNWIDNLYARTEAYEEQLNRFFAWADSDASSPLLGNAVAAVELYDALAGKAEAGVVWDEQALPPNILAQLSDGLLMYGSWHELAQALLDAQADDWSTAVSFVSAEDLDEDDTSTEATLKFQSQQQNYVLNLLDAGCPKPFTLDDAVASYDEIVSDFPRLGPLLASHVARCLTWDVDPAEPRLIAEGLQSPPLLVMSGLHDPATPHAEAIALVEQFANGSKLVSSDSEGHGVGTSTDCETDALTSFMATVNAEAAPAQCAKATPSNLLMLRTLSQRRPRASAGRLL